MLFALPLGLDTFALSTVLGVTPLPRHARVRLALTFATAEGLMPALGLLLGLPLGRAIGEWSAYVAGALICGVGLWMIKKERQENEDDQDDQDDDRAYGAQDETVRIATAATKSGWALLGLALSVSLDELAVGFSFGVLGFPLVPALAVIALQALILSLSGQWIGRRMGQTTGERAEKLAGPAPCVVGLWFIFEQVVGLHL